MKRLWPLPDGRRVDLNYFVRRRPYLWRRPVAERACREVVNLPTHPRAGAATARRSVRLVLSIGRPTG